MLTRPEFERRYEAMLHLKKAELIEGVVYMPSPVRHEGHGRQHFTLNWWLGGYIATPGVEAVTMPLSAWIWTMNHSPICFFAFGMMVNPMLMKTALSMALLS
jgi:hypothetical protein